MQKKLLTVAVASALAMPAVALAAVTVYGTLDPGLHQQSKIYTGVGVNTDSALQMNSGQRTTDRWGIKGSEDLGGGMKANFTLEGSYNSDTGSGPNAAGSSAGIFGRKAIVGLSKGGNSFNLGHDYTANFKSQGIYDPMSYTYTGITPTAVTNVAGTRNSNMIEGSFRFGTGGILVEMALGEAVGESWGTRMGVMGDFAFGPVTITGAFSTVKDKATGTRKTDTTNFGGKYAMGAFTFRAGMSDQKTSGGVAPELKQPLMVVGVQYNISPTMSGRFGYYSGKFKSNGTEIGTRKITMVAMDYNLSKQTTAYVELDRKGLTGTQDSLGTAGTFADGATGIGAGIVHKF